MNAGLRVGFEDPVLQAQACFRAVLQALARPGTPQALPAGPDVAHDALHQLLLTLTDPDTPVWWQTPDLATLDWLRFHTGAPTTHDPKNAAFAVVDDPTQDVSPALFQQGQDTAPEQSTTLLVRVPGWISGKARVWSGPGIQDARQIHMEGPSDRFWAAWQAQSAHFPRGVDVVFCAGTALMGLPRSTRVHDGKEV